MMDLWLGLRVAAWLFVIGLIIREALRQADASDADDGTCSDCGCSLANVADDRCVPAGEIGPRYTVCLNCDPGALDEYENYDDYGVQGRAL